MDDFRHAVQASLTALGTNTLDLLRSRDLLLSLVRRQLVEKATESVNPPLDLIQKALIEHCQKEQLNNDASISFLAKDQYSVRLIISPWYVEGNKERKLILSF